MPVPPETPEMLQEKTVVGESTVIISSNIQEISTQNETLAGESTMPVPSEIEGETVPMALASPTVHAYEHFGSEAAPGALFTAQPGAAETIPARSDSLQNTYQIVPGQLQPGQPMPVPPKKRRVGLWIALAIVVALLIGGGTAFAIVASQRPTNTPAQALQTFCHGYKTLNAQELYSTLSNASQKDTSLVQIQQSFDLLQSFSSLVKIANCTVSNIQQKDTTATGIITLTESVSFGAISTSTAVSIPTKLVLENNTWKIDLSQTRSNFTMPTFTVPTFPPDFLTPTPSDNSNQ